MRRGGMREGGGGFISAYPSRCGCSEAVDRSVTSLGSRGHPECEGKSGPDRQCRLQLLGCLRYGAGVRAAFVPIHLPSSIQRGLRNL